MPTDSKDSVTDPNQSENPSTPYRAKTYRLLMPNLRSRTAEVPAVFLWVGRARRPEGVEASQADLVFDYWYAPLIRHRGDANYFPHPTDLGEPFSVIGSVAELARVRIGRVYRDGSRIRSFPGLEYRFPQICLRRGAIESVQRLADVRDATGGYQVDFDEFAAGIGCAGSYVVDIRGVCGEDGNVHRLIFPWFTVARYFFAGSSSLLNLLFTSGLTGTPNRVFDRDISGWLDDDGVYGVRLEKWVPDKDARVVAHLAAHDLFHAAAERLSASLAGQLGADRPDAFPNCFFPTPVMRDVELRCLRLHSQANEPCLLVLEIVRADVRQAFQRNIRGIVFWRDNDGRATMQRDLAEARQGGLMHLPGDPSPEATLDSRPGQRGNSSVPPTELREEGYYSTFADDRRIPAFKPEKDEQETRSDNCRLIPTDELRDWYTTAPDGTPLHGQAARRAFLTGGSLERIDVLPTGDEVPELPRLRMLCRIARALAAKGYGVEWIPRRQPSLLSFDFQRPADDAVRVTKWIQPREGRRRYWVCEVRNETTQRFFYLPEIEDRRGKYSGCILGHISCNHRFTEEEIEQLMSCCANALGRWSKVELPPEYVKVPYYHNRRRRQNDPPPDVNDYVRRIERTLKRKTFHPRSNETS